MSQRPLARLQYITFFLTACACCPGVLHAGEIDETPRQNATAETIQATVNDPAFRAALDSPRPGRERLRWDKQERALLWNYVALNAVDAYQTMSIDGNYRESNPVISSWAGEHPSDLEIVAFKAVTTWGLMKLTDRYVKKRKTRKMVLWLLNAIQLSVDVHNELLTNGSSF